MSERLIHFVPFDCAGVLDTRDDGPDWEPTEVDGVPVAALDFSDRPDATRLHLSLCQVAGPTGVLAEASPWVSLAGDTGDIAHSGHPLVQFALYAAGEEGHSPTEALGFVVCAQCHDEFLQHVTTAERIAVGPCDPDRAGEEGLDEFAPHLLLAENDPDHVAWIELQAWRYAYTVARAQQT
jgi:hypothetical protein